MNSKEFEWNLKIVSPSKVRELQEALASYPDEREFFKERINKVNQRIAQLEDTGRQKCYLGYKIGRFGYHPKKQDAQEKLNITYCGITRKCNVEDVAFMEVYYDQVITVEHNHLVKLYVEFDDNWDKFMYLERKINATGGKIVFHRPYVDIALPVVNSLEIAIYPDLACNCRNYDTLETMLQTQTSTKLVG